MQKQSKIKGLRPGYVSEMGGVKSRLRVRRVRHRIRLQNLFIDHPLYRNPLRLRKNPKFKEIGAKIDSRISGSALDQCSPLVAFFRE